MNAVRLSHDGNYCMTAGDDRSVKLFNPHKDDPSQSAGNRHEALLIKNYTGVHGYQILDVVISRDNAKFATGGGDKSCFYWDVSTGRVIRRIQAHNHRINAVTMNEDGTLLLTASYDRSLAIWDLRSNARDAIQVMTDATDSVTSVLATATTIVSGSVDGKLRTYDLRAGQLREDTVRDPITAVRLTNDGKCALCTCLGNSARGVEGVVRLVNLSTGQVLQEYRGGHTHERFKLESSVTNDDCQVVVCSEDGSFVHYDLVKGGVVRRAQTKPPTHGRADLSAVGSKLSPALSSLSHHPSKPLLVTAAYDGDVKVWDVSQ